MIFHLKINSALYHVQKYPNLYLSGSVNIFSKTACNVGIIDEFSLQEYAESAKNIFRCDFVEKSITLQQKENKTRNKTKECHIDI